MILPLQIVNLESDMHDAIALHTAMLSTEPYSQLDAPHYWHYVKSYKDNPLRKAFDTLCAAWSRYEASLQSESSDQRLSPTGTGAEAKMNGIKRDSGEEGAGNFEGRGSPPPTPRPASPPPPTLSPLPPLAPPRRLNRTVRVFVAWKA